MLITDYQPFAFPQKYGPNLTQANTLRCTWADLVWAAMTVGRKHLQYVIQPETYAYFELVYRSTLLYTNLQAADYRPGLWGPADTPLRQSATYHGLSPTEKSGVSYFIGLTMAKLFADKLLDVAWLLHADTYGQRLGAELAGKLPDLIGLDSQSAWLVVAVKGRSHWLNKRAVKQAKRRAQILTSIAAHQPGLQIGFCSYFSGNEKIVKVYLEDPPVGPGTEKGRALDVRPDAFLADYYRLIFNFLSSEYGGATTAVTSGNRTYRVKPIPEANIQIGLDEQVYAFTQSGQSALSGNLINTLPGITLPQHESGEKIKIGSDGIYVQLGDRWGDDKMYAPPPERNR